MNNLIESIKKHEGFNGSPYICSEGHLTIGYGTLLPITKDEAELLLKHRLNIAIKEINKKENFIAELPDSKKEIIYEMVYQLGITGVLKFKKMIEALKNNNYEEAAIQMLDSKWATQTPNRAIELANKMRQPV